MELRAANAADYLKGRGIELDAPRISELGGGVSNTVLLVESGERRFVLKQSLGKLRVEQEWLADRERIFREDSCLVSAVLGHGPGEERDKRGAKGTLGEQAAKEVRQALRHKERIGDRSCAENGRGQDVADKAEDPAYCRVGTDCRDGTQQGHPAGVDEIDRRENARSCSCFKTKMPVAPCMAGTRPGTKTSDCRVEAGIQP